VNDGEEIYAGSAISRGKVVPLISSYAAGPLGLIHLPRLWLKGLLYALGILAEDWGFGPGGLDRRITDAVGIDREAFVPWLLQTFPTYAECEAWVRAHARTLTPEAIAGSNAALTSAPLPRGLGAQFRRYLQIDDPSVDVGIMLNNLDDWMAVYRYVGEYRDRLEPIVPAIGPGITGPLGVVVLPRLWLKAVLGVANALPPDYPLATEPADEAVLRALGIAPADAARFLIAAFPTYVGFESWIREQTGPVSAARVAAVNALLSPAATDAAHAYDWDLLHRTLAVRRFAGLAVPTIGILPFQR
jgi:hypothetical protein